MADDNVYENKYDDPYYYKYLKYRYKYLLELNGGGPTSKTERMKKKLKKFPGKVGKIAKSGYDSASEGAKRGYKAAKSSSKESYKAVKSSSKRGYKAAKSSSIKGYEKARDSAERKYIRIRNKSPLRFTDQEMLERQARKEQKAISKGQRTGATSKKSHRDISANETEDERDARQRSEMIKFQKTQREEQEARHQQGLNKLRHEGQKKGIFTGCRIEGDKLKCNATESGITGDFQNCHVDSNQLFCKS
jgi:hypothetical protein